jgi:aerotaxis receptor
MQLSGQAQTMTETVRVFRIDASAPAQARDAVALRKEMKAVSPQETLAAA